MGSEPILTAATVPACSATLAASCQSMLWNLSRPLGPSCADLGLACRVPWERPRAGRGRVRAARGVVYEEPARLARGRRMALRYDEVALNGPGRWRITAELGFE